MADFDVSKPWVILIPSGIRPAKTAAEELSRILNLLRQQAGLNLPPPEIFDDTRPVPKTAEAAEIVLNCAVSSPDADSAGNTEPLHKNGFAWRTGAGRVEIYGNSKQGLRKGLYNFLAALGIRWPEPDREEIPPAKSGAPAIYPLADSSAYQPDLGDPARRKRFLLSGVKGREAALVWAARNGFDALVLPLREFPLPHKFGNRTLRTLASLYALDIEAGGAELSSLVPRRLFSLNRELFRMEEGRRKKDGLFCVTNPKTIAVIQKNAARLFTNADAAVFHLWPDPKSDTRWCSCPNCRAFSPEEQNRIAVNAAADTLLKIKPWAQLSYYEPRDEMAAEDGPGEQNVPAEQTGYIAPRPNTFRIIITGGNTRI
ncbi:MAG: hypothetical protein LBP74_01905 [Treponema sp.]|jgi:hypothetical protein|nr:hypothetical protein [Treponema sp.]